MPTGWIAAFRVYQAKVDENKALDEALIEDIIKASRECPNCTVLPQAGDEDAVFSKDSGEDVVFKCGLYGLKDTYSPPSGYDASEIEDSFVPNAGVTAVRLDYGRTVKRTTDTRSEGSPAPMAVNMASDTLFDVVRDRNAAREILIRRANRAQKKDGCPIGDLSDPQSGGGVNRHRANRLSTLTGKPVSNKT